MPELTGETPVYGPSFPTRFQLRGIRLIEGEDGAGSGEDEGEENETDAEETEAEEEQQEQTEDADSGLKKALAAERKARREAERKAKGLEQQLADKDKPADEQALDQARREAEQAATERANARIVRSELKAAAAGKVRRPDLLVKVTDLSSIEVDENGDPDPDALEDAIAAFLEDYPELAADQAKFSGTADQGTKGRQSAPAQLTRDDIKNMTPEQINKARSEGRLNKVLGVN